MDNKHVTSIVSIVPIIITILLVLAMILSFVIIKQNNNDTDNDESKSSQTDTIGVENSTDDFVESTDSENTDTESIKCPNFVNMTIDNIESHQYYKNEFLKFSFEYIESSEYDINRVCEQSIEPDKIVKKGSEITLYISTGQNKIRIPNVYGMTEVQAVSMLESIGFLTEIEQIASNDVQAGKVISTDPAIGTTVTQDTVVTIYISSGAPVSSDSENNTSSENTSTDTTPANPIVGKWSGSMATFSGNEHEIKDFDIVFNNDRTYTMQYYDGGTRTGKYTYSDKAITIGGVAAFQYDALYNDQGVYKAIISDNISPSSIIAISLTRTDEGPFTPVN